MATDVMQAIEDLIADILGNRDSAVQYVEDGQGTLVAQGVTDLGGGVDMRQLVEETCSGLDLPDSTRQALQNYTSGQAGPPGPAHSVDQVMQHLNYVTYVAYEGDEIIQQEITNIDQSQNVDIDGEVHGDISVDSHDVNANATGDGSAASGYGPATAGDENVVNTGVNTGNMNSGDGAVQVQALGSDVGPINTGDDFTGIQADGPVAVTGGAFGEGAEANTAIGNVTGPGGAVSAGGDASGHYEDNDTTEQTQIQAIDSQVAVEQGPGDQHAEQDDGFDLPYLREEPVRLLEREGDDGDEPLEAL